MHRYLRPQKRKERASEFLSAALFKRCFPSLVCGILKKKGTNELIYQIEIESQM